MAAAIPQLIIASTALTAGTQLLEGNAQAAAAKSEAKQLEANAKATYAEGTRASAEHRRVKDKNLSDMRASMAASGGTTTDAAATRMLGRAASVGNYNALAAMYSYETKAHGQQAQADARRIEGKNAKRLSRIKSLGTVLSGATGYGMYKNAQNP